jgi:hypothetical protein
MSVSFERQLDGIPCWNEEVNIRFEEHQRLTNLEITWHQVEPSTSYPVASLQQMSVWIKEGRARGRSYTVCGPGQSVTNASPSPTKRITITSIDLYYSAADHGDFDRLYPYVVLGVDTERGPNDSDGIILFCPVISDFLPKVSR